MKFYLKKPEFKEAVEPMHGVYRHFEWFAWCPVRTSGKYIWLETVIRHENEWGWGFLTIWYTELGSENEN